ncbi:hypothetical protein D0C36_23420 [Mucilaginibacter conchicola]|uniref:Uncharacterized protein n=1 Tax=Mucilaginibacter conchicola TaxID=2303333 RepID=A0A372NMM8_9SPHI|nr:hypothetical protein D0C36_23420 [Mucilaginibacter conchicola]
MPGKAFRTMGCKILPLLRSRIALASASIAMPLQPHHLTLFCPLSPEAFLLTGVEKRIKKEKA